MKREDWLLVIFILVLTGTMFFLHIHLPEKAAQAMGEAMYQQQANASGNANYNGTGYTSDSGNNSGNNNDDVVDADFKTK